MNDDSTQALRAVLLPGFGVLRIGGADAVTFLQGQFTNDVRLLADGRTQVAACCTNQGRVIALVRFRQTDEAIYALLPADLLGKVATHLRKFVLRSKVEILQAADLNVGAILTGDAAAAAQAHRVFDEAALTMSPVPLAGTTEVVTFQYAPGREVIAAPPVAWRSISGLSLSRPSPLAQSRVARCRHRRRPAARVCGDVGAVHSADAQRRPDRRRQLHQGLLHRDRRSSRGRIISVA